MAVIFWEDEEREYGKKKTKFTNFINFIKVLLISEGIASEKRWCILLSFYHTVKYALRAYGEHGTELCTQLTPSKVPTGFRKTFKKKKSVQVELPRTSVNKASF